MNTDLKSLERPRKTLVISIVAVLLAIVAGYGGWRLFTKLTTNTVVAYFTQTNSLYAGDEVTIMGIPVGVIDSVEPAGDKMKVTFHYPTKYKVPVNASAVILNPSLVASRNIQLEPAYTGGETLGDNTVIPIERTQVPAEWDDLRNSVSDAVTALGPTPEQPKGPIGDTIESLADGLAGKGQEINKSLNAVSTALSAINDSRGETFAILRGLAAFLNQLQISEQQLESLNTNLAQITSSLSPTDHDVADAVESLNGLLPVLQKFLDENGEIATQDVNNLSEATTPLVQADTASYLETFLHVFPTFAANANNAYHPSHGSLTIIPAVTNFANPIQLICGSIQAGSRLGYQDSAELCAQYLTPVLDAIKFNHLPFGLMPFSTAESLPKHVAYSEPRLQPPSGYKDTTVPGIFSPDTLFSHGNFEPGWVTAPGMQGTQVRPSTGNLLTPASLSQLMGGPDPLPAPAGQNMAGPPNAYDESSPLPPPWYPQPAPPPPPGPDVVPGPVAPVPAPAAPGQPAAGPLPAEVGAGR
ncbi:virulence factor Mce family protein [Mycolicibacterium hippocampi]|uniref:Mce family protein Mce1D n=1 Tax=Mycolicibacterium hippocampi TaxID=659824 RepID=A0A7I9ZM27_9MYCO|nr:virulence factor Mce family protein [Mycolicibacterium hippocampi]GFH02075.1 Mce family protein Mce1D [Mycolicibacterium hippocampi]